MTSASALAADGGQRACFVRRVHDALAVLLALHATHMPGAAQAQSAASIELSWQAPLECPTDEDVRKRIVALVGSKQQPSAAVRAEAVVTRISPAKMQLRLVTRAAGVTGHRTLEGASCDALAGAAAVHVALLLQSRAGSSAPSDAASQPRPSLQAGERPKGPRVEAEAVASRTSARWSRSTAELSASDAGTSPPERAAVAEPVLQPLLQIPAVAIGFGPSTRPSLGATLAAGISLRRWYVTAEGTLRLQQTWSAADRLEVGAHVGHGSITGRACRALATGTIGLAPCVSISIEHLWARGVGSHIVPETARATWAALGLGVQARFRAARVINLLGSADVQLHGSRARISLDGVGVLGQLSVVALQLRFGVEWIL